MHLNFIQHYVNYISVKQGKIHHNICDFRNLYKPKIKRIFLNVIKRKTTAKSVLSGETTKTFFQVKNKTEDACNLQLHTTLYQKF